MGARACRDPLTLNAQQQSLFNSGIPCVRRITLHIARVSGCLGHADDMMQDALIALARCAQRFDPARGVPFTSYISPRISGEVRDYMRYRVDPLSREDRRRRRLKGQEPRPDVSFELLEYDKEDRHRYLEQTDAVDELRSVLAEFSDRERRMCLSWFGSELPMHTIAKQEGLCESRVSQLMTGVRQRLRARFGEDAAPRVPKKHPKKMVRCLVTS